jgi:hypothetical protein
MLFFLSFPLDAVEAFTIVATTACLIASFWLGVIEPNPVLVESQSFARDYGHALKKAS